jgi:hypothetical protein
MNDTAASNNSNSTDEAPRQVEKIRQQIRAAQNKVAGSPLALDIGLDDDLLAAFNAGVDQTLVLLIQIVRLLRNGG